MVSVDDLEECWCCGSLHDSFGGLCPSCDDANCNRFTDECKSGHIPVSNVGAFEESQE